FRYWAKCAWNDRDLALLLAQAKRRGDDEIPVFEVVVDGNPEKRRHQNRTKRVTDHYRSVIELARRTAPPVFAKLTEDGPLISFVVPVYNTPPKYLDDLVASFRDQPMATAELILCDDGSTSAPTVSWLAKHQVVLDLRIILNKANRGPALATNSGIEVARG